MRDMVQIADVVKHTISETFDNVTILKVNVTADEYDDEILNIEIIFEGTPKDLDARKVSGAVRHVRPKLTEIGESAFPLLSFVSKGDAGQLEFA